MRVVIGLGNPGPKYHSTRHNIGFRIVDQFALNLKIPFQPGKGDYYFAESGVGENRILIAKPTTFMNNSGMAFQHILRYFPVKVDDFLVVSDDFNLPFGSLRFRAAGSAGGHNGLKSVIQLAGTDQFSRLRFGIGKEFRDTVSFVLSKFSRAEEAKMPELIDIAVEGIEHWIREGIEATMNKFNKLYI